MTGALAAGAVLVTSVLASGASAAPTPVARSLGSAESVAVLGLGAPAPGDALQARPGSHCPDGPPCGRGHDDGWDGDWDGDRDDDGDPKDPKDPYQPPPPPPSPPTVGTVGQVLVGHANIPPRSGPSGFARGMRQVLADRPDFVTLNEQFNRSVPAISKVAVGYSGFRVTRVPKGRGSREALGTVVLWKRSAWTFVRGNRIRMVNDDRARFGGRIVVWDRYATWATLKSKRSGEVVSVVSVHHMTNPGKYGPNKAKRQRAYRVGMNRLVRLTKNLSARGPVLVGGDFNVHAGQRQPWTAVSKMSRAGFRWHASGVDYLFYPSSRGVRLLGSCTLTHARRVSDHPFLVGRFALNAAGVRQRARAAC